MEENKQELLQAEEGMTSPSVTALFLCDLFIGRPMPSLRYNDPRNHNEEIKDAFSAFLTYADEVKADIVVLGGNVVDSEYLTNETLFFLSQAFEKREKCHFIVAPGPADHYEKYCAWRSKRWPRNFHLLSDEVLGSIHFYDLKVSVYGWGYRNETCTVSPLVGTHATPKGHLSLLCGRTDLMGAGSLACPVTEEELASFGADFITLFGKKHDGFRMVGNSVCTYCGAFQSRFFDENESGGYVMLKAEAGENGWKLSYERRATDTYHCVDCTLDVSHTKNMSTAMEKARSLFQKKGYNEKTAVRLHLTGIVSPKTVFYAPDDVSAFGVYSLTIVDETLPLEGGEALLHEMSAAGELYRHFYSDMTQGDTEQRLRAARAFRVGYAALCGEDFARY